MSRKLVPLCEISLAVFSVYVSVMFQHGFLLVTERYEQIFDESILVFILRGHGIDKARVRKRGHKGFELGGMESEILLLRGFKVFVFFHKFGKNKLLTFPLGFNTLVVHHGVLLRKTVENGALYLIVDKLRQRPTVIILFHGTRKRIESRFLRRHVFLSGKRDLFVVGSVLVARYSVVYFCQSVKQKRVVFVFEFVAVEYAVHSQLVVRSVFCQILVKPLDVVVIVVEGKPAQG